MSGYIQEDPGLHPLPSEKYPSVLPQAYVVHDGSNDPNHGMIPVQELYEVPQDTKQAEKRYFGFRPKTFFGLIILAVLIVAGIIGGVVGGVLAGKTNSSKSDNDAGQAKDAATSGLASATSSPSRTTTSIPAVKTDAVSDPVRQITACECDVTIFVTHQDEHGDLYMRGYYNKAGKWFDGKRINTTIEASMNTPLASVCWKYSDYFEFRVYYISKDNEYTQVAAQCPVDGPACSNFHYSSIDANVLSKTGGLTVTSPRLNQLKAYGLDENGTLLEHTYSPGENFEAWVPVDDLPKAHKNSPLAVGMNDDEMNLVWFDEDHNLQTSKISLRSSGEVVSWGPAQNISSDQPSVLPAALALAISEDPEVTQVFYLDDSAFNDNARRNGKWSKGSIPSSVTTSTVDQGPIAAVGWNDTAVRIYYVVRGEIVELQYETTTGWSTGTLQPYPY